MNDLVYNIDFEIAAFLFAVVLFIETSVGYPMRTRKNRIFRTMAVLVIITEALDMASAITISYGERISRVANIIVNSGFFMSGLLLCFMLHYYIQYAVVPPEGRQVLINTNKAILTAMELSVVLNAFFGYYFSFSDKGAYVHGPLYLLMHGASLWFVICASASLIFNRKLLKRSQLASSFFFILLYFAAVALQTFVFPDVLIIMPTVSGMLVIAFFSLESPDFVQLQTTLHELTETKRELELANEKYCALAYTDQMTGLENRAAYNIRLEQLDGEALPESVTILIADVNNLKLLNDNYGHAVGDDAIIRAARLLKRNFTECCQCYRIGGDEFAVIARGISEAAFVERYDRFARDVRAEGARTRYPFSVAAGYQNAGSLSLIEALRLADQSMYRDKELGKRAWPDSHMSGGE